jgi:lipoyl(octanoyl) transferase
VTAPAAGPVLRQLGKADYVQTWEAMRAFTERRTPTTADELWIVEHPPVYTLGQAARREHVLAAGDVPVVATDRGGQVTYHGPGQVVVYTLVDLRRLGIFVKELVYRIEQAVVQTLDAAGVDGRRVRGAPGVYVPFAKAPHTAVEPQFAGLAKIAALGVKISRGCAYHGVALNVAMDLTPFERIDPCGYVGLPTVDLATLGVAWSWADAAEMLSRRLAVHLSPAAVAPSPATA